MFRRKDFFLQGRGWRYWLIAQEITDLDLNNTKTVTEFCQASEMPKASLADLQKYMRHCKGKYKEHTTQIYVTSVVRFAKVLGKGFDNLTEADVKHFVEEEDKKKLGDTTKQLLRAALCMFFKWKEGSDYLPDYARFLSRLKGKKKSVELKITGDSILRVEEISKMVQACPNMRDKALIFALFDSGARVSELTQLKISDLIKEGQCWSAWVDGKTGKRKVYFPRCSHLLQQWLEQHCFGTEKDAFLFCPIGTRQANVSLHASVVNSILKEAAKRAKIDKRRRVNPHSLRHSKITETCRVGGCSHQLANKLYGWSDNSNMYLHYSHLVQEDADNEIARQFGKKEVKKTELEVFEICPQCGKENSKGRRYCDSGCGHCFDPEVAKAEMEKVLEREKEVQESMQRMIDARFETIFGKFDATLQNKEAFVKEAAKRASQAWDTKEKKKKGQETLDKYA